MKDNTIRQPYTHVTCLIQNPMQLSVCIHSRLPVGLPLLFVAHIINHNPSGTNKPPENHMLIPSHSIGSVRPNLLKIVYMPTVNYQPSELD